MPSIEGAVESLQGALKDFRDDHRKLTKDESKALNDCLQEIAAVTGSCKYHRHSETD